jgi:hypothetical protein
LGDDVFPPTASFLLQWNILTYEAACN